MKDIIKIIKDLHLNCVRVNHKAPKYLLLSRDCEELLLSHELTQQMVSYSATNKIEKFRGLQILIIADKEEFVDVVG